MARTLQGLILEATGGPTVNEGLLAWFQARGAAGIADFNQAERKFLQVATAEPASTTKTNNEMWAILLIAGGYGSIPFSRNDAELAYWADQSGGPPISFAYDLTVATLSNNYGYALGQFGALDPTSWPSGTSAPSEIWYFYATFTDFFLVRPQSQIRPVGCFSLAIALEGWTGGYGAANNIFSVYWSPNDFQRDPDLNLKNYMVSLVGQQVGFNAISCNNWLNVGTDNTFWGWSNGGGFGSMADYGSTEYTWPFSTVIVNFYCDAADNLTVQFNQGTGLTAIHVLIPGLAGSQQVTLPATVGTSVYSASIPGVTALFQSQLTANKRIALTVEQ